MIATPKQSGKRYCIEPEIIKAKVFTTFKASIQSNDFLLFR
jgi:hypothetical protein